jgi:hypothetical protein
MATYTLTIQANIDPDYVKYAFEKAATLIPVPKKVSFYVIDHPNFCPIFAKDLPKKPKKTYTDFCKRERTSMSITWNRHEHILIHITPEEEYMRTNEKAFIGTILHEIMHSNLGVKLDDKIYKDMHAAFDKFKKQLAYVKYTDKQISDFYSKISETAAFVLLDIYGNSELVKKRLTNYLVEDYGSLYACKKRCAKPKLPPKKQKLKYIADAFDYELSLLSVIMPFMRTSNKKAKKLVKHLEKNFESNVPEVALNLQDLKKYCSKNLADTSKFRRKYFTIIYEAALRLLI